MPASYNPTKGMVQYTAPRRTQPLTPAAPPAPPQATTPVVQQAPETPALTKTKGVAPSGQQARTVNQREATSTKGLPFRDLTANPQLGATESVNFDPSDPPEQAVMSAMAEMGYDPGSSNPAIKSLIDAAPAIQEAYMIREVLHGSGQPGVDADLAQGRSYAQFIRDVVARGSLRSVASQAARDAPAAAQRIAALGAGEDESAVTRMARGSLGTNQLPGVLSRLYGQVYTGADEQTGQEVQARLRQLAARQMAGNDQARQQLLNYKR